MRPVRETRGRRRNRDCAGAERADGDGHRAIDRVRGIVDGVTEHVAARALVEKRSAIAAEGARRSGGVSRQRLGETTRSTGIEGVDLAVCTDEVDGPVAAD